MPIPRIRIPDPLAADAFDPALVQLPSDPLTWWRQLPPAAIDLDVQRTLRATLLDRLPPSVSALTAVRDVDPAAAAVRAALTALATVPTRSDRAVSPDDPGAIGALDAALSVVLLCAAQGDLACAAVLAHALGRRARRRADLTTLCLARAWRHPVSDPAGVSAMPIARR